ncbi:MAG: hypothetical protein HYZ57_19665 [Acidobacteria bacterium]|nr:hypothetical protein [Acidobacteriota bacterium]MBI3282046.1 hypothetical protein [Acidobacteriota bacterium]
MNGPLKVMLVSWISLALVVIALALYRHLVAKKEDDSLHVRDDETVLVSQQNAVAHRLAWIDRWGKSLTVLAVLYGLLIAGIYFFNVWQAQSHKLWSE